MPRNAAGVYTLPDPPRVPNTTIDSPDENTTRDDIGAELTNSLDRNGRGGMLAPFRIADGNVAAPGLGFLNDPDNGLYRIGGDDWAVACAGAKVMEFTSAAVNLSPGGGANVAVFTANAIAFTPGGVNNSLLLGVNTVTIPATATLQILGPFFSSGGAASFAGPLIVQNGIIHTGNPIAMSLGTNGTLGFEIVHVGAPVNWVAVFPSVAASAPTVVARGADASISLGLSGKGSGGVDLYGNTAGQLVLRAFPGAGPNFLIVTAGVNPTLQPSGGNLIVNSSLQVNGNIVANAGAVFATAANQPSVFGAGAAFAGADTINIGGLLSGIALKNSRVGSDNNWSVIRNMGVLGASDITFGTGGGTALTLESNKKATFLGPVSLEPTFQLYLDGGGDTYLQESAPNILRFTVGGTGSVNIFSNGLSVEPTGILYLDGGGNTFLREPIGDTVVIVNGSVEHFRINSLGFTRFSNSGDYISNTGTWHEFNKTSAVSTITLYIRDTTAGGGANCAGIGIQYSAAAPNGTANEFWHCSDSSAVRALMRSNGGLANFSANNVNLSDAGVKDYIEPLAGADAIELWKAHRDVEWCSFKYRDQTHDDPNFGYIAQDIERKFANVAPWLVEEDEKGTKWVYATDLDNIGHAVLSAAQRRIEALEALAGIKH